MPSPLEPKPFSDHPAELSRSEHDALAELFLGGGLPGAAEPQGEPKLTLRLPDEPGTPLIISRDEEDNDPIMAGFTGEPHPAHAAPIGPVPMPSRKPAQPRGAEPTEPAAERTQSSEPRVAPELPSDREIAQRGKRRSASERTEALVMGHLPVRSGPWASQYAKATADRLQAPVALIRLSDGRIAVDLHAPPGRRPRVATADHDGASAVAHALRLADHVILLAEELDETALIQSSTVGCVTLLTGASESAVVSAYRSVKGMVSFEQSQQDGEEHPIKPIQLAVMGTDQRKADRIGKKLSDSARVFLGREVAIMGSIGRIGPTGGLALFRGEFAGEIEDLLTLVRTAIESPQEAPSRGGNAGTISESKAQNLGATRIGAEGSDHLALHLDQGLEPLAMTCPREPGIQLALDPDGRLHLLASDSEPGIVERLTGVASWANDHRALIAMAAQAQITPEPAALHIFTRSATRYRAILETPVKVHLLVEVKGGGWACATLN